MTQCQECGVTLNSVATYTMPGVPIVCEGCFDALADSERAAQIDAANEARAKTLRRRDSSRVHCPAVTMERDELAYDSVECRVYAVGYENGVAYASDYQSVKACALILMSLLTFLGRMGEPLESRVGNPTGCPHAKGSHLSPRGVELCNHCRWPMPKK